MRPAALMAILVLTSCTTGPRAAPSPSPSPATATPAASLSTRSPTPTVTAECALRVLGAMTEEQRIGQLFLLGLANDQLGTAETNAIRTYHFGSVWFVEQSRAGTAAIRTVADSVQALATAET